MIATQLLRKARQKRYINYFAAIICVFMFIGLIASTTQENIAQGDSLGTPPSLTLTDETNPDIQIKALGDGDQGDGDQGDESSDPPPREDLEIKIKKTDNSFETLTSAEDFESYDKSQIKWIMIKNRWMYVGYAMEGSWGHNEIIYAPNTPSYDITEIREPLFGLFLQVHFKYQDTWYTRYLTSNEWGDFRSSLSIEETLWGDSHRLWDISFEGTITVGQHSIYFKIGIKISTSDQDCKIYSIIEPLTQSYEDFGFTYVMVENPDQSIPDEFRVNYLKFNNGTHQKIIDSHQERDIVADSPNHLLYCEALNTNDPSSPFYLWKWDFNDLRQSGLSSLTFESANTSLPDDNYMWSLNTGGIYGRSVAQNEEIIIDPLINTDPEATFTDDSAATFDGTFTGMGDTNEYLEMTMSSPAITEEQTSPATIKGDATSYFGQEIYLEDGEIVTSIGMLWNEDSPGSGLTTTFGLDDTKAGTSYLGGSTAGGGNDYFWVTHTLDGGGYEITSTGLYYIVARKTGGTEVPKEVCMANDDGYRGATYTAYSNAGDENKDAQFYVYSKSQNTVGNYISTTKDGTVNFDWRIMNIDSVLDGANIDLYVDTAPDSAFSGGYSWTKVHDLVGGNETNIDISEATYPDLDEQYLRYKIDVVSGGTDNTWLDGVDVGNIQGSGPSITNLVESAIGSDPFVIDADITDVSSIDTVLISYWHSSDNGSSDVFAAVVGNNFTMVLESGDTYTNNSLTLSLCSNETYVRYIIYTNDTVNNWALTTGYYLFDEGPSLTDSNINNNERLQINADHTVQVNCTQITQGIGITISNVQFRYKYTDPTTGAKTWTSYITMDLFSGDSTSGIYRGTLEINDTLFEEDEEYELEFKGTNSNGMTITLSKDFISDSTPDSGLDLGRLNAPDVILCGNYTEDIMFYATIVYAESFESYSRVIPQSWRDLLVDTDLITSISIDEQYIDSIEILDNWRLILTFEDGQAPDEDDSTKLRIYQKEPQITNPTVIKVGTDSIDYSLDVSSERNWTTPLHIGEIWFPSSSNAWWSDYKPSDLYYKVYTDKALTTEIEGAEVSVVSTNYQDEYIIALDLVFTYDAIETLENLYIHGSRDVERATSQFNLTAILIGALIPTAAITIILLDEPLKLNLAANIKKYVIIGGAIGGVGVSAIFQFIPLPLAIQTTPLTIGAQDLIGTSNYANMLFLIVTPALLSLAIVYVLKVPPKQKVRGISGGLLGSIIIAIAQLTGILNLSLMDTTLRATINMASYIGVGISIIAILYLVKTADPSFGRR